MAGQWGSQTLGQVEFALRIPRVEVTNSHHSFFAARAWQEPHVVVVTRVIVADMQEIALKLLILLPAAKRGSGYIRLRHVLDRDFHITNNHNHSKQNPLSSKEPFYLLLFHPEINYLLATIISHIQLRAPEISNRGSSTH